MTAARAVINGLSDDVPGLLGPPKKKLTKEEEIRKFADKARADREYEAQRCPTCRCHPYEHGGDDYGW